MTYREVGGSLVWQGTVSGTDQTTIGLYEPTHAVRIFLENPGSPVIENTVQVFTGDGGTIINTTASGAVTITGAGTVNVITEGTILTVSGQLPDHGNLPGLLDDDHPQYLLIDGTRAMSGNLDLDSNDIIDIEALTAVTGTFTTGLTIGTSSIHLDNNAITAPSGIYIDSLTVSGVPVALGFDIDGLQQQLDLLENPDALIGTDGITVISGANTITLQGFYPEFIAASGSLQNQFDSLDDEFSTDAELTAVSGHLQAQLDDIDFPEFVETALVGLDGVTIVSGSNTTTVSGFYSEFVAASGSLQSSLNDVEQDIADLDLLSATDAELLTVSGHLQSQLDGIEFIETAIVGTNGITIVSGSNTVSVDGFYAEFVAASGVLQQQFDDLDLNYATDAELLAVSGHLQNEIDSIVFPEFTETALTGSDGITIISGSNTVDIQGFRPEFIATSGSLQSQLDSLDDFFATDSELITVSGHLQNEIDSIVFPEFTETALIGSDGITIISGSNTTDIQGFRTEFVSASGSLQTQIDEPDVSSLNTLQGDLVLQGADGIDVSDDTIDTITLTGFRPEFLSASGSLQSQIDNLDTLFATDVELVSVSGHLQGQLNDLDNVFATDAELTAVSGHLQTQLDAIDFPEFNETAIEGFDGITVVSGSNSVELSGFYPEFVAASGSLQSQISNIDVDEPEPAILGFDGITVVSGANSIDLTGFRPEFVSASGALQTSISDLSSSLTNAILFNGTPPTTSGQIFTANNTTGVSAIATGARITPAGVITGGFATNTHHILPGNVANSVSIGGTDLSANLTQATSAQATAIGPGCRATSTSTTAVGISSVASQAFSVAIGGAAIASGFFSTAIGVGCSATFNGAVAIGNASAATSNNAIAIGSNASSTFGDSVALGSNATTIVSNQLQFGVTTSLVSVSGILQMQPRTSDPTGTQLRSGSIWIRSDTSPPQLRYRSGGITYVVSGTAI